MRITGYDRKRKEEGAGIRRPVSLPVSCPDLWTGILCRISRLQRETEPSAATIAFLTDKVREDGVPVVFHLELSNGRVADAIAEAAGAETAMIHSCHTLTAEEAEREETYVSLMRQNLAALERALND